MSDLAYTFFPDLAAEASIPRRGIHSQTLSDEGGVELVLFALAAGERLSEHTAARPAIVHVLSGEGDLTVAGDEHPDGVAALFAGHLRAEIGVGLVAVAAVDEQHRRYRFVGGHPPTVERNGRVGRLQGNLLEG